jgi:hypothetical protein
MIKESILSGAIRRYNHFIGNGSKSIDHALNERTPQKWLERLILTHAGGLSASLNDNS